MSLFDSLGGLVDSVLKGNSSNLLAMAEQALNSAGGVNGVLAQLRQAGLGDQVASWLGNGHNMPVSSDQIQAALSSQQLQSLASSFGIDISQVSSLLAEHLPKAVDAASPNGTLQG